MCLWSLRATSHVSIIVIVPLCAVTRRSTLATSATPATPDTFAINRAIYSSIVTRYRRASKSASPSEAHFYTVSECFIPVIKAFSHLDLLLLVTSCSTPLIYSFSQYIWLDNTVTHLTIYPFNIFPYTSITLFNQPGVWCSSYSIISGLRCDCKLRTFT